MEEEGHIIPNGPFKGKRIEFAPTKTVDMFTDIGEPFMKEIFNFDPGDYCISDESSLFDFDGVEEMEVPDIQKKIKEKYGITGSQRHLGAMW